MGTATTIGTQNGYDGFGPESMPPAGWTPFAADSAFNETVEGMRPHPRSGLIVPNLLKLFGKPAPLVAGRSSQPRDDWDHPPFFAQPDDPLYAVIIKSTGHLNGFAKGTQIHVTPGTEPADGSDGHCCVVQPDGRAAETYQTVIDHAKRTVTALNGGWVSLTGPGNDGVCTAAHFALLAGTIRPEELIGGEINHALFAVFKYGSRAHDFGYDGMPAGYLQRDGNGSDFVAPAKAADQTISGPNLLPMGARLALDYTPSEIEALPIPRYRKTIAHALATHGLIFGDTGGQGFQFQLQSGESYTAFGEPDPAVTLAKSLGIKPWNGLYNFDIASGIDWTRSWVAVP